MVSDSRGRGSYNNTPLTTPKIVDDVYYEWAFWQRKLLPNDVLNNEQLKKGGWNAFRSKERPSNSLRKRVQTHWFFEATLHQKKPLISLEKVHLALFLHSFKLRQMKCLDVEFIRVFGVFLKNALLRTLLRSWNLEVIMIFFCFLHGFLDTVHIVLILLS